MHYLYIYIDFFYNKNFFIKILHLSISVNGISYNYLDYFQICLAPKISFRAGFIQASILFKAMPCSSLFVPKSLWT